jgi:hypothetical protein
VSKNNQYELDEYNIYHTSLVSNPLAKYSIPWLPISFHPRFTVVSVYILNDNHMSIEYIAYFTRLDDNTIARYCAPLELISLDSIFSVVSV